VTPIGQVCVCVRAVYVTDVILAGRCGTHLTYGYYTQDSLYRVTVITAADDVCAGIVGTKNFFWKSALVCDRITPYQISATNDGGCDYAFRNVIVFFFSFLSFGTKRRHVDKPSTASGYKSPRTTT
jgi:hypothetical protein